MTVYFHIDVNSAYLSWTAIRLLAQGYPVDIRTIPSVIGGDISQRRGVVLAKSVPAKAFSITTGEPIAYAMRKCPTLKSFPPDHTYYEQCSRHMMDLLENYSPEIHQYSIDECFMRYVPFPGGEEPVAAAHVIRERIFKELGFTVNIGVSVNKLLAKMASDFQKPNRVHTLFPEEISKKMWPLPVRDLFMVGRSAGRTLELLGIRTIGELANTDPDILYSHLKSHGRTIYEYANGRENPPIDTPNPISKGIGNSVTLPSDVTNRSDAEKVLASLSETVSSRLQHAGQCAGMVSVEIKYNDFQIRSHQLQLPTPSNKKDVLYTHSLRLFDELWNQNPIRLLGIRTSKLVSSDSLQLNFQDVKSEQKQVDLDRALEKIRNKYGEHAVFRGSSLK